MAGWKRQVVKNPALTNYTACACCYKTKQKGQVWWTRGSVHICNPCALSLRRATQNEGR